MEITLIVVWALCMNHWLGSTNYLHVNYIYVLPLPDMACKLVNRWSILVIKCYIILSAGHEYPPRLLDEIVSAKLLLVSESA